MLQWVQDRFVEDSQAVLPLQDKGLLRAYAIFDYLRVSQGVPLFLEAYLQRFSRSAAAMHLHLPLDLLETGQIIRELIRRNSVSEAGIRLILTAGSIPDDHYPFESRLAILCEPPRQPDPQALQEGIRLYPYPYLRFMPRVKTTHYVPYMVLLPLLRAQGWHDVLWNFQGRVLEASRANLFLIDREGTFITPGEDVLEGITRSIVLDQASKHFSVRVRDVSWEDIRAAEAWFLTSTTKGVMPVQQIGPDHSRSSAQHPGVREMQALFQLAEREYIEKEKSQ